MAITQKSFTQLFEDMRDRMPPALTDFQEGSVVRTLLESFSYEMAVLYEQMHRVYLSAYVDTATDVHLDQVVAILGIKRGEPDFATGEVTFVRDVGIDQTLVIPKGTLVTTEDTDEAPKLAYETIESEALEPDQTTVAVRVQAMQRGEATETAAETVVVMPQPVPGVKEVYNLTPIRFTGKQRETDEELRDRAKKTLIAASGANATAIEHALLSVPGVKEVKVRENFHFAQGHVTLRVMAATAEGIIPKGTIVTRVLPTGNKTFATTAAIGFSGGGSVTVPVQAVIAGEAGEVSAAQTFGWQSLRLETEPSVLFEVSSDAAIEMRDFGICEVFVDGVDFDDAAKVQQLEQVIERTRAAGIYTFLKPAQAITVDGVFQLELTPGLQLSATERQQLETEAVAAIATHLKRQRMEQPLLISQLSKQLLELDGVNDLVNFTLSVGRDVGIRALGMVTLHYESGDRPVTIPADTPLITLTTLGRQIFLTTQAVLLDNDVETITVPVRAGIEGSAGELLRAGRLVEWQSVAVGTTTLSVHNSAPILLDRQHYDATEKPVQRLTADLLEKFIPRYIRVATDHKPLPIDVQIQGENLDEAKESTILAALQQYFDALGVGASVNVTALETHISEPVTVILTPHFWQPTLPFDGETVSVSLVEVAQLGTVFLYDQPLQITGALKVTLPVTLTRPEKEQIYQQVRRAVATYLDQRQPEENIPLADLVAVAKDVEQVLDVGWKLADFQVLGVAEAADRIDPDREEIRVEQFEKPQLAADFVIDSDVQAIPVKLVALSLRLFVTGLVPPGLELEPLEASLMAAVRHGFDNQFHQKLPQLPIGQPLDYEQFKTSVQILMREQVNGLSQTTLRNLMTPAAALANLTSDEQQERVNLARSLLRGAEYTIDELTLASGDQTFTADIPMRIMERVEMATITTEVRDAIAITVELALEEQPDIDITAETTAETTTGTTAAEEDVNE